MVPSQCYGRPIEVWLLYNELPLFFGPRLYVLHLDEVKVLPVPFNADFSVATVSSIGGHLG